MLFVVAGNYREAKFWADGNHIKLWGDEAKYISRPDVLLGVRRPVYTTVGRWYIHPQHQAIQAQLEASEARRLVPQEAAALAGLLRKIKDGTANMAGVAKLDPGSMEILYDMLGQPARRPRNPAAPKREDEIAKAKEVVAAAAEAAGVTDAELDAVLETVADEEGLEP